MSLFQTLYYELSAIETDLVWPTKISLSRFVSNKAENVVKKLIGQFYSDLQLVIAASNTLISNYGKNVEEALERLINHLDHYNQQITIDETFVKSDILNHYLKG